MMKICWHSGLFSAYGNLLNEVMQEAHKYSKADNYNLKRIARKVAENNNKKFNWITI